MSEVKNAWEGMYSELMSEFLLTISEQLFSVKTSFN